MGVDTQKLHALLMLTLGKELLHQRQRLESNGKRRIFFIPLHVKTNELNTDGRMMQSFVYFFKEIENGTTKPNRVCKPNKRKYAFLDSRHVLCVLF